LAALDDHPFNPRRARSLGDVKPVLVAQFAEHNPRGLAMTMRHTVPASPVRDLVQKNSAPALMVVGRREASFVPARAFVEEQMPHLDVAELDAGHAMNIHDPAGFNAAVGAFIRSL